MARWTVKLGFNFLLLSYVLVLVLFFKAFFNESYAVVVFINNYLERWVELGVAVLSFIFVPSFIMEANKKGVIRFFWQKESRRYVK